MGSITTGALLPVEIVDDIICHVLSSHYWSHFIEGQVTYRENGEIRYRNRHVTLVNDAAGGPGEDLAKEWDPVTAMSGINVIFRDQTLQIGSRLLGIPRAVDGR
jgi:hypothetical protein